MTKRSGILLGVLILALAAFGSAPAPVQAIGGTACDQCDDDLALCIQWANSQAQYCTSTPFQCELQHESLLDMCDMSWSECISFCTENPFEPPLG